MIDNGFNGRMMEIAHVNNRPLAKKISNLMREKFPDIHVKIRSTSGLCTMYTEDGGITVGYERDIKA